MLQFALAHIGASVATVKDTKGLTELASEYAVSGAVVKDSDSWLAHASLQLPPILLSGDDSNHRGAVVAFSSLSTAAADNGDCIASGESLLGVYNGSPLTHNNAMKLGMDAAQHLGIRGEDRVCVSVTLFHAFGIGSAVGCALSTGASVVLPAVGGIRGCGNPKQRAEVTMEVMQSTKATILFADTHTYKALPESHHNNDYLSLRGGVVKTGSGSDFLPTAGFIYAGANLKEMGKLV